MCLGLQVMLTKHCPTPATATSSLRAPSELPESFQRAFNSWANYSNLELLVKHLFVIFFIVVTTFIGRFLCLTRYLFCHVFFHFCKCWKFFLMFCIDKFNKTRSCFICTVGQFDVFLVCVIFFELSLLLLQFRQSWNWPQLRRAPIVKVL